VKRCRRSGALLLNRWRGVACDENGLAVFERLRRKPSGKHVFLYAFDLLELDGQDLWREPLETRKVTLASVGAFRGCVHASVCRT